MRKLLLAFTMMCVAICSHAAKAYPFPVTITQSDGTQLTIVQHGDEDFHWTTTTDGVILARQESGDYFVAVIDEQGNLKATSQLAHNAEQRTLAERSLIKEQNRDAFLSRAQQAMELSPRRRVPISTNANRHYFPHHGTPKAPVILVEFADSTFSLNNPRRAFNYYLNGIGEPDPNNGETALPASVKQYFKLMSNNAFEPTFDVYGPVKVKGKTGNYKNNREALVKEACTLMDDSLDFSQYDYDNDGYIDLVYVIYAGYAASITGNADNCIWPAASSGSLGTFDGKTGYRWGVNNELNGYPGAFAQPPYKRINGQGLFCHEFSHTMGLPDFYPNNTSAKVSNQSMEFWDLMDGGEYCGNGYYPASYTGWEREAMGWLKVDTLDKAGTIELAALDLGGKSYRIPNPNSPNGNEYFMLETIAKYGWNYAQRAHGLMVYHVNYPYNEVNTGDYPNNTKGKPAMTVIPADGLLLTSYAINETINPTTGKKYTQMDFYNELAGDLFPSANNVTTLDGSSALPNFSWFNGTDKTIKFALSNISYDAETRLVTFDFVPDVTLAVERANLDSQEQNADIYAIDGRKMPAGSQLPKGLYIKGNKKFVVR